jgi:hypothetical protein
LDCLRCDLRDLLPLPFFRRHDHDEQHYGHQQQRHGVAVLLRSTLLGDDGNILHYQEPDDHLQHEGDEQNGRDGQHRLQYLHLFGIQHLPLILVVASVLPKRTTRILPHMNY